MGVLHRDLKPSNIGFNATGAAKLLDFGLATLVSPLRLADDDRLFDLVETSERFAGTAAYVPPEIHRGASCSPAVDLWALAVTMLGAVSGVNPFAMNQRAAALRGDASVDVHDVCSRHLDAIPSLRTFLERALASSPALRFQTAPEFRDALESVARALAMPVGD